jgi:hypothetical protein
MEGSEQIIRLGDVNTILAEANRRRNARQGNR